MYIERYIKKIHFKYLQRFFEHRELDKALLEDLPEHGYMAYLEDFPIACGFLRRCEGNFGIIDGFCSDPKMPGSLRHEALDLITSKLIRDAKELKLKGLLAITVDKSIIKRSIRHNFKKSDQVVMSLLLSE